MEDYFIKSGLSLVLLYLSYRFVFRQPLRHQANRFLGLFCVVFSMILPFFNFENANAIQAVIGEAFVEKVPLNLLALPAKTNSDTAVNLWLLIYCMGMGFFFLRFVRGLWKLLGFYVNASKSRQWGFIVAGTNKPLSPFTFFNILFITRGDLKMENTDVLIAHEQCHRDQWHSVDALFLELATIVFWFNPAIWLFQQAVRSEHEFMADRHVLRRGVDLTEYQHLLFRFNTGVSLSLGNNLINKVSLIKRFEMMTQVNNKTNNTYYRLAIHACLVAVIFFFSAFTGLNTDSIDTDTPAQYKEGNNEMYRLIRSQIKYPAEARREKSTGKVNVSFTVNTQGKVETVKINGKKGHLLNEIKVVGYAAQGDTRRTKKVNRAIKTEVVRVVKLLGDFIPAKKDGEAVSTSMTIPFEFDLK